jgi:nitrite reductase/ring-hydroxylating ferredoxin subunit
MNHPWVPIASLDDLIPGRGAGALVAGDCVAVFLLGDGTIHAVGSIDPLSGANVMARGLVGSAVVDGIDVRFVVSPLDKVRYRLDTGERLSGDGAGLGVWPVRVVGGVIEVGGRVADVTSAA